MPKVRLSFIPLLLALAAVAWFATRPGLMTFFLSVCAFFLWASMLFTEFVLSKAKPWGRKIEQVVREATGELPIPVAPADPKLKKLHDLLLKAEARPET